MSEVIECSKPDCVLKNEADNGEAPCEMAEKCTAACAAYGRVCPCAARAAGKAACTAVQKLMEGSVIIPEKPDFNLLNPDDLVIGEKLGEGGFSNVNACTISGEEAAVKYLKRKVMVNQSHFEYGAADLALEAHVLSALKHKHIIRLLGVTAGSVQTNVATGKECGFFIAVERLHDTLEKRIEKWGLENEANKGSLMSRISGDAQKKQKADLFERITIARDIASAMEYLHGLNLVYRDLKPDNIGFDEQGNVKIFDFGLAKELKPGTEKEDGTYDLSGNTGSRRYMAPEVARELPYDKSVDVYSFGIMLWELATCVKPFFGYSSGKHMSRVVVAGERPKMDQSYASCWPLNLQWLMKRCWSPNASARPSFTLARQTLDDILAGIESLPEGMVEEETVEEDPKDVKPRRGSFAKMLRPKWKGRHSTTGSHQTESRPQTTIPEATVEEEKPSVDEVKELKPPKGGFKSMLKPKWKGRHSTTGSHDIEDRQEKTRRTSWTFRK